MQYILIHNTFFVNRNQKITALDKQKISIKLHKNQCIKIDKYSAVSPFLSAVKWVHENCYYSCTAHHSRLARLDSSSVAGRKIFFVFSGGYGRRLQYTRKHRLHKQAFPCCPFLRAPKYTCCYRQFDFCQDMSIPYIHTNQIQLLQI